MLLCCFFILYLRVVQGEDPENLLLARVVSNHRPRHYQCRTLTPELLANDGIAIFKVGALPRTTFAAHPGIEPGTLTLTGCRSTAELKGKMPRECPSP